MAIPPPDPAPPAPVILVDEGHGQRFVIGEEGPLHLSRAASIFRREGVEIRPLREPFTDQTLSGVRAVIISGPFQPVLPSEVDALMRFLERGGNLAILIHIPSPLAPLLDRLDVNFTNMVVHEQSGVIGEDTANFRVTTLSPHPLFDSILRFSLYGGWGLDALSPSTRVIARTSPSAWLDVDGDRVLSRGDMLGSFGVVVAGSRGAGRFVVFGDDAVIQNRFLDQENERLVTNLVHFLSSR